MDNILQLLRPVDKKRLNGMQERLDTPLARDDVWFVHTVLAQCFLPYRDPKTRDWMRQNGDYSIVLTSGALPNPRDPKQLMDVGLPYGAKPRLFQSYIATQAVRCSGLQTAAPGPANKEAFRLTFGLMATFGDVA
jgi:hypothetical protein